MTTILRLLGLAAFLWLTCFTGAKLIKMARIRGFLSGPPPESKLITAMTTEPGSYTPVYWLAWNDADIHVRSRHRINLPKEVWETYQPGDPIEIFYFPGDPLPYHRKDIFADNGNFVFDAVLLSGWLFGIVTLSLFQIRHFRRKRRQLPPPLPNARRR
jgi:hypothetical protein